MDDLSRSQLCNGVSAPYFRLDDAILQVAFSLNGGAMPEAEELSALIGDIYDAVLEPTLWPRVLPRSAQFVGGPAASLFSKDAARKSGDYAYDCGIDAHYRQLYFEKYIKLDPLTIGHFYAEVEVPVAVADIMSYAEFLETRAFQEWGRPQGLVDVLNVALDKTATSAAMYCVFRHERDGQVDDEMRRRMRLIVPHLRRAVLIGRVIELQDSRSRRPRRYRRRHQRRHVSGRRERADRPRQCKRPCHAGPGFASARCGRQARSQ